MSQQVVVNKNLVLDDFAVIKGNYNTEKMCLDDHFTGATLDTERWVAASNNGGTEAITAGSGGTATLTTSTTDDDRSIIASNLIFLCARKPIVEARFKVSAATTVGINFGFNDATTEGNDALAMELTAAALTNAKTTDGVMFVYDTDGTYDHWYCAAVDTDVEGTPVLAKSVGYINNGTARLNGGGPQVLTAGTNTITLDGVGTYFIDLPVGATGTATDGTATVTGSPVALTAGRNTITATDAGTVTIVQGLTPGTTYQTLRIELDATANATFYFNGEAVGRLAACTTTTAPLCAFLGVISRAGTAARAVTIDYIRAWDG